MELREYTPEMLAIFAAAPNCIVRSCWTAYFLHMSARGWSLLRREQQSSRQSQGAAVRQILLVSAETTTSSQRSSTPFWESATGRIKTVSNPGLAASHKLRGSLRNTIQSDGFTSPKAIDETWLILQINSNFASCARVLQPGPSLIEGQPATWNNCHCGRHDGCLDTCRDPPLCGKEDVCCEIWSGRCIYTNRTGKLSTPSRAHRLTGDLLTVLHPLRKR